MNRPNVPEQSPVSAHEKRSWVSVPNEVHRQNLIKRAAVAYIRLPALGGEIADAIGKHHTTVVHRKKGEGPLPLVLEEIDACERRGINTDSFLFAIIETQLDARATVAEANAIELSRQEQALDHAEDVAQHRMLAKEPGGSRAWKEALVQYIGFAQRAVMAIGRVA